jgi:PII-like signaling protein
MSTPHLQLSVLVSERTRYRRHPRYAEIVHRAHKRGLAGASVFRGIEGFGHSHHVHEANLFELSSHLPVLVVVVDTEARVRRFLSLLDDITPMAMLVAISPIEVLTPAQEVAG